MGRVHLADLPRAPQSSVSALVFLFRLCWSSQAPPPLPPAFRWLSTSRAVHLAALAAELRPQNAGFPEASRIIPAHTCTFKTYRNYNFNLFVRVPDVHDESGTRRTRNRTNPVNFRKCPANVLTMEGRDRRRNSAQCSFLDV